LFDLKADGTACIKIPVEIEDPAVRVQVLELSESLERYEEVETVIHSMPVEEAGGVE
jgi:hypothetical protein